ncbi:MAG: hypothetical protein IH998_06090, partial [Proteobacteria bacterium]|nr:hypothetical protein [Pseudomonadota bacterium]
MIQNEFNRPQRLDTIGAGESQVRVAAEPGERAALAERFGLKAIDSLAADYRIRRDARGIVATGRLSARVVQACVITDEQGQSLVQATESIPSFIGTLPKTVGH